jgi:GNAT superfamily N-acetyltransferase
MGKEAEPADRADTAKRRRSALRSGGDMHEIIQIYEWPAAAIAELLAESESEGFRFVRRAQDEWLSGANRFANEGEAIFGVFEGERLVAIGGINRESGRCGRLRRFYVRRDGRRKGIGGQLVQHVLAFARRHYSRVELRCDTDVADRFYRAVGFSRTSAVSGVTHAMDLRMEANRTPEPTPATPRSITPRAEGPTGQD